MYKVPLPLSSSPESLESNPFRPSALPTDTVGVRSNGIILCGECDSDSVIHFLLFLLRYGTVASLHENRGGSWSCEGRGKLIE